MWTNLVFLFVFFKLPTIGRNLSLFSSGGVGCSLFEENVHLSGLAASCWAIENRCLLARVFCVSESLPLYGRMRLQIRREMKRWTALFWRILMGRAKYLHAISTEHEPCPEANRTSGGRWNTCRNKRHGGQIGSNAVVDDERKSRIVNESNHLLPRETTQIMSILYFTSAFMNIREQRVDSLALFLVRSLFFDWWLVGRLFMLTLWQPTLRWNDMA